MKTYSAEWLSRQFSAVIKAEVSEVSLGAVDRLNDR